VAEGVAEGEANLLPLLAIGRDGGGPGGRPPMRGAGGLPRVPTGGLGGLRNAFGGAGGGMPAGGPGGMGVDGGAPEEPLKKASISAADMPSLFIFWRTAPSGSLFFRIIAYLANLSLLWLLPAEDENEEEDDEGGPGGLGGGYAGTVAVAEGAGAGAGAGTETGTGADAVGDAAAAGFEDEKREESIEGFEASPAFELSGAGVVVGNVGVVVGVGFRSSAGVSADVGPGDPGERAAETGTDAEAAGTEIGAGTAAVGDDIAAGLEDEKREERREDFAAGASVDAGAVVVSIVDAGVVVSVGAEADDDGAARGAAEEGALCSAASLLRTSTLSLRTWAAAVASALAVVVAESSAFLWSSIRSEMSKYVCM
jgi:hypothetical protein